MVRVSEVPLCDFSAEQIFRDRSIVAEQLSERGRHLVLKGRQGRHRLLIDPTLKTRTTPVIACNLDHHIVARLDAATALFNKGGTPPFLRPTPFQRHRLCTMLSILDTVERLGKAAATSRRIASTAIYPGMHFGSAIEWKTSSHRRQTQRLVAEAKHMARNGYRKLLAGRYREAK